MKQNILNRLAALEAGSPERKRLLFACIIDGVEMRLTAIDYAFMLLQGHDGSMGGICGETYAEPFPVNPDGVAAAFAELEAQYNSPDAKAQRDKEYQELQRLGELRRMDCLCGRDMDKCHPLPWQKN